MTFWKAVAAHPQYGVMFEYQEEYSDGSDGTERRFEGALGSPFIYVWSMDPLTSLYVPP